MKTKAPWSPEGMCTMAPLNLGPNGWAPLSRDVGTEMLLSVGVATALLVSRTNIPPTTKAHKSVTNPPHFSYLIFCVL